MTKKKNSKNFKPQVPEKKVLEHNEEKKSGSKLKILSLVVLFWSAIIYGIYIPAVSKSLDGFGQRSVGRVLVGSHSS